MLTRELAVNLCLALQRRGLDITLAAGAAPEGVPEHVAAVAAERGLKIRQGLRLKKHFNWIANFRDARLLRSCLRECDWDLLHVHLLNDHLLAAGARKGMDRPIPIVRTSYDGGGMPTNIRTRWLLRKGTDALIEPSRTAQDADVERFGVPRDRTFVIPPAIDLNRFDPERSLEEMRPRLGLRADDFVVGIVARMQTHRRFNVLLDAVRMAAAKVPRLRLVIVGRGTRRQKVAVQPVEKMGLNEVVKFAGYLSGDEYVAALDAFDAKIFLVPGSDGSCRAVREAMAMGKPVIASRRGILPELVQDGVTGLVVTDTPQRLADAIQRLATDRALCSTLGASARRYALETFCPDAQAEAVERVYGKLLNGAR